MPETNALLGSVYGQLISSQPSLGMELGMASQREDDEALRTGADNPRVWLLTGMGAIFSPPEYGGGLPVAEQRLNRAIELFKQDNPPPGQPRWGHAEAYVWLGQVYEKQGNKQKAASAYAKAVELAPHNIQVNGITPGFFRTEMNAPLVEDREFSAWVARRTPAGRWGEPAEVAGAAVFLASDAADYVTGHLLAVDGGFGAAY